MKFDQAKLVVDEIRLAMESLSNAGEVIDKIDDKELKKVMGAFIANTVMDILENIILPVEEMYPELDPFREN